MTDKTIIEEIQRRSDRIDFNLLHCASEEEADEYLDEAIADRDTLLSILAEVAAKAEGWGNGTIGSSFGLEGIAGTKAGIQQCTNDLQAILNRTNQQGGNA